MMLSNCDGYGYYSRKRAKLKIDPDGKIAFEIEIVAPPEKTFPEVAYDDEVHSFGADAHG